MKIKNAIILCAGFGKRLRPLTKKTPKPLIKISEITLLENTIRFLCSIKIKKIFINIHHLGDQIRIFLKKNKFDVDIKIIDESKKLLNTGGGALNMSKKIKNDKFFILNPDTIWGKNYKKDFYRLEKTYFRYKKPVMLLVSKKKSFDKSFKGDFNLNENIVRRDINNELIFTGLQILDRSVFNLTKNKIFSMNKIWDDLINNKSLYGINSKQKFYHLNSKEIYDRISILKIIH